MSLENRSPGKFALTLNLSEKNASFNNTVHQERFHQLPVAGPPHL